MSGHVFGPLGTYQVVAAPSLPPNGLTGLIGWWDASVFASLTLSGSNINAIADQSGAGNNLAVVTTSPQYNATGFNSRPAMMFAGNQDVGKTVFTFGTGNTLTAFFVGQQTVSSGASGRYLSYTGGGDANDTLSKSFLLARNQSFSSVWLYRNANNIQAAFGYNTPHRCIATIDSSGAMAVWVDGVLTSGATFNLAFGASGPLAVGSAYGSALDGAIGEIGICNADNTSQVAALDTYLKNKWGL